LATIFNRYTSWIDIVLSRSVRTLPHVVCLRVRAGEWFRRAGLGIDRYGLCLCTRIVSATNSNLLAKVVLDLNGDFRCARDTELVAKAWVGEV
jgi:hypothetical protein